MPHSNIQRYLRHGTLSQLRVFEASARLGSFARAAEELSMAQPTASVQIKKLSEAIGLPLFEQVGKRTYLTEAGRCLHAACADIFGALARLEEAVSAMRGLRCGRLQVAATSTARYFAPRLLGAFSDLHPGITTSLHTYNRSALIERLRTNEDDLYMFADPPDDEEVIVQAILPNPLVVIARANHPLASATHIPFARFAEEPFLIRETGSGTRMVALRLFAEHGLEPKIRMEMNSNDAILEAIAAGLGVSILSRYSLGLVPGLSGLIALDVEGFPIEGQWRFVYPVGKQLSVAARAFLDYTRTEGGTLLREALGGR
jgi:LysR family transcriptional regulator, low CO2-responsive transcriptional regulator